jgi:hypothetical protein
LNDKGFCAIVEVIGVFAESNGQEKKSDPGKHWVGKQKIVTPTIGTHRQGRTEQCD